MSNSQQDGPPQKEERLGFFGYAIGLVIFFLLMIAFSVVPGISGIIRLLLYVEPGYTLPYLLSQIYPIFLAIPFFFIRRKKTIT